MSISKQARKSTLSTVLLVFAVLAVVLVFLYQRSSRVPLKQVNTSLVLPNSEYALDPIQYDPNVREEEKVTPFVRVHPGTPLYFLVMHDEENMMKKGTLAPSFYASKRVSELEKWKNEYRLTREYRSLHDLAGDLKMLPTLFKPQEYSRYMTWEAVFARYYNLYRREVDALEQESDEHARVDHISKLKRLAGLDQVRIYGTIINSGLGKDEQQYLKHVSDDVFSDIEKRMAAAGPRLSGRMLAYPLSDIVQKKDFGLYDIVIDAGNLPQGLRFTLDGVDLETAWYDFVQQQQNQADRGTDLTIPVIESAHALQLKMDAVPLAQQGTWVQQQIHNNTYRYVIPLDIPAAEIVYTVNVSYKTRVPVNFQLARKEPGKTSLIIDENLYPHSYRKEFERRMILRNAADAGSFQLVINSSEMLTEDDFKGIKVSVSRLLMPQIILNKSSYLAGREPKVTYDQINRNAFRISVSDANSVVDGYIAESLRPGWTVTKRIDLEDNAYALIVENAFRITILRLMTACALIFGAAILFLSAWVHNDHDLVVASIRRIYRHYATVSRIAGRLAYGYGWISRAVMRRSIRIGSFLAYPLIAFIIILAACDFVFIKVYGDQFIIAAGLAWMLISIGFLINRRTPFALMIMSFAASAYMYVAGSKTEAITAAGWGSMFLCCGLVYTASYRWILALHAGIKRPGTSLIEHAETYLKQGFSPIYRIVRKAIVAYFDKLLIRPPVKKRHHIWNLSVICTTTAAVLYLCYLAGSAGITVYHAYKDAEHRSLRESLNPHITKVEPTIVYHSTKVVIYGNGFGWQAEGKRTLRKDGEEVNVDLWTDTKIIFTIPLHWKAGTVSLWAERPLLWEGKTITAKSNIQKIKLIPTTSTFTPEDDAYFQQLKTLSPETLKLNGYQQ